MIQGVVGTVGLAAKGLQPYKNLKVSHIVDSGKTAPAILHHDDSSALHRRAWVNYQILRPVTLNPKP